ncbi:MAG: HypC/HybG/HupF family hydrogenase formation chaperone [Heliobacteriaceae bacterium]|nr:HypC/HybG/HupF family hydrogenase formation chaperone [Heliobacteriaceae bacterium]MDD4587040.1 HypC/HybG/HupF family hydrogenase formation chaperone [Heliobacteriaceae bacterium]
MCVAIPGKIVAVAGAIGKVDFNGNLVDVNLNMVKAGVGDYVLVHAGVALQVLAKDEAEEMLDLFRQLEEVVNN